MITEITDTTVKTVGVVSWGSGSLPLIILPPVVIALRSLFPDWVFMWLLASAVFFGCKWMTWRRADRSGAGRIRSLAYLLAWPGMDAREFFADTPVARPAAADFILAAGKTLFGAALLAFAAAGSMEAPLPAAWAGMIGTILLLHFGTFHLLALIYRAAGIAATPLMRSPSLSVSLSEFWGNRWNTGFNKLVHELVFRPLARRTGAVCGFLAIFWATRLFVAAFVFDLRPYLTNGWRRVGLAMANTVFACLPILYTFAALKGGTS